jgi:hypothetical protein
MVTRSSDHGCACTCKHISMVTRSSDHGCAYTCKHISMVTRSSDHGRACTKHRIISCLQWCHVTELDLCRHCCYTVCRQADSTATMEHVIPLHPHQQRWAVFSVWFVQRLYLENLNTVQSARVVGLESLQANTSARVWHCYETVAPGGGVGGGGPPPL